MILILFLIMDGEYAFDGVAMVEVCEVCILINAQRCCTESHAVMKIALWPIDFEPSLTPAITLVCI